MTQRPSFFEHFPRLAPDASGGLLPVCGQRHGAGSKYEEQVATWKTHEDVAKWLRSNFIFDRARQSQVLAELKETGPENVLTRKPDTLFENRNGYCRDAAAFAKDALNRINPDHQARYIFIKNSAGPTNHWVTGYKVDGRILRHRLRRRQTLVQHGRCAWPVAVAGRVQDFSFFPEPEGLFGRGGEVARHLRTED